ncbi:T9SS type A sorting domain-containing protein [Flavivirga algicola]|uniref:T9SS type A sorting domain-containing protein n=1 Tax=Flavivirga algicola TaxID=2729136 RepID=A0ABX1S3J9_9FLAO|nr:T9SS type A sorting domain-containing protein [Flavivirga algicola]NMH89212.1 T9SS type A sorting domain-containing protein [Flavivirga algicola]
MKKNYLKIKIIVCVWVLCSFSLYGQIQDGVIDDPGDIVFVAFHDNDDGFSFLFLDNCPNGTSIRFIDEGWNGTSFNSTTSEGEVLWTNNTGTTIVAGTVIDITDADDNNLGIQATLGVATEDESGFSTGVTNEQIYAVTGTRAAPGTFLAFVGDTDDGSDPASLSGTGLVAGSTALILIDNEGYYTGSTTCNGTIEQCATMFNTSGNWTTGSFSFPSAVPDTADGSAIAPDTTNPQVQSITRQNPTTSPTNADTLTWDVTFDEAVSLVDPADFSLSGTTATVTGVTNPSGNIYRVTASGGDLANANATVVLSFSGGQNIIDSVGNALTDTTPTGTNDNNFVIDNTAPTISIGTPSAGAANNGPITYTITYTGANSVTLSNGDISLNTTGTATGSIAVTGSGTATRTVTISSISGDGSLGISIAADTASDTVGNSASAAGPSATFTVDNTAPTLAIGAPSASSTSSGPITYTITYTGADAVTLANGDISLNTTGTATGSIAVTGSGTATRTVTISSISGDGSLGISIAADTASDTAGNSALAAGPSATFTVDNTLNVQSDILANELNIYPIPAQNIITISSETSLGLQNVKLFNLQGKLILSKKLDTNSNTNAIDISLMPSGLYLMHISSKNGFATKRIIKQ